MKKFMLSLLGVSLLLLSACNSTNLTATEDNNQLKKPDIETEQISEPTPTPGTSLLSIGDSAPLGDWEISVTDFYYTDKIDMSSYTYYHPDEGNQYAVVVAQVTNNGTAMGTFLPTYSMSNDVRAKIYYADKYEYSASVLFGVDDDLHDETLNPLTSKEGIIVFSIPDAVVDGEDSLVIILSSGHDELTFSLR